MSTRAPGTPRALLSGDGGGGRTLLGLLLLLCAGLLGPDGWTLPGHGTAHSVPGAEVGAEPNPGRPVGEPVADLLAPLGPVKAVLSSALWVVFVREFAAGSDAGVAVAEGLLALHPTLDQVRLRLAQHLVVNAAGRAPDDARHRALVLRGLAMLEDGIERAPSALLHGALGRLVLERSHADARFARVAESYFGLALGEVAIEQFRAASRGRSPLPIDRFWLADQLLDRGLDTLQRFQDAYDAGRDLREAEDVLATLDDDVAAMLSPKLEALRDEWERVSASESENS